MSDNLAHAVLPMGALTDDIPLLLGLLAIPSTPEFRQVGASEAVRVRVRDIEVGIRRQ